MSRTAIGLTFLAILVVGIVLGSMRFLSDLLAHDLWPVITVCGGIVAGALLARYRT